MFTKKLFVVFMAVAMIFSIFAFSTFAVYDSDSKGNFSWSLSYDGSYASASASNSAGTVDSFMAVEYLSGDWDQAEDSGSSTYIGISCAGLAISVCSEHDFYIAGQYVETWGIDFYEGEDFYN